jgi:uncharacterized membrane protein
MEFGPVQLLVVGFENGKFEGKILAELKRLREHDIIRLVDLLVVHRTSEEEVERIEHSDLSQEEAMEFGALAGALLGLGADGEEGAEAGAELGAAAAEDGSILDGETWYLADHIPVGTTAGIALIEHRWAVPLRDAILDAGGATLADTWIHPQDLVALGAVARANAGADQD